MALLHAAHDLADCVAQAFCFSCVIKMPILIFALHNELWEITEHPQTKTDLMIVPNVLMYQFLHEVITYNSFSNTSQTTLYLMQTLIITLMRRGISVKPAAVINGR